uniref:Uncharacterized protein n=1 Tax=Anguilla anguilla TaxID=7936 RepID=A0A0E9QD53_ANGAN
MGAVHVRCLSELFCAALRVPHSHLHVLYFSCMFRSCDPPYLTVARLYYSMYT